MIARAAGRTFVDANVLIEILFARNLAPQCTQALSDQHQEYAISALTVHIIWYLAERHKLPIKNVDAMLAPFAVLPILEQTLKLARRRYDGADFEDCVQAACAEAGDCDEIITIDKNFQVDSGTRLAARVISGNS